MAIAIDETQKLIDTMQWSLIGSIIPDWPAVPKKNNNSTKRSQGTYN